MSTFLPPDIGMVEYEHKSFTVKISSPARAVMECLYLAPKSQPLVEVYELLEGLNNLCPDNAQLEHLTSTRSDLHNWHPPERAVSLDKLSATRLAG